MGRLRAKIKYRPVIFELMAPTFTLLQLQRAVEAMNDTVNLITDQVNRLERLSS